MKYLFLDTNIFLHFVDFEQIPWADLIGDSEITIVVSDIVAQEIDKHKDTARGKIQKRAKKISSKLAEVFLEDKKMNLPIVYCDSVPSNLPADVKDKFDPMSQDDKILMSVLASEFKNENVVIVSYDNPILIKSKKIGLKYLKMPDTYLLKEELSEEEKELDKYKTELAAIKNRMSKPILVLNNEKEVLHIEKGQIIDIDNVLHEYMSEIKNKYPYKQLPNRDGALKSIQYIEASLILSDSRNIKRYNDFLDSYYEKEEAYYKNLLLQKVLDERMVKLSFSLYNQGTDETGNVNVFVEFPDDIKLYSERDKKKIEIYRPTAPPKFHPLLAPILQEELKPKSFADHSTFKIWDLNASLETNKFSFITSQVNHHVVQTLSKDEDMIYVDKMTCGKFQIKYHIIDSKHTDSIDGVINVIVE